MVTRVLNNQTYSQGEKDTLNRFANLKRHAHTTVQGAITEIE